MSGEKSMENSGKRMAKQEDIEALDRLEGDLNKLVTVRIFDNRTKTSNPVTYTRGEWLQFLKDEDPENRLYIYTPEDRKRIKEAIGYVDIK